MSTRKRDEPRRPYAAPRVSIHGDVQQVTANVGNMSKNGDNGVGSMHKTF